MAEERNYAASPDAPTLPSAVNGHPLRVQFSGSGSEYFRIWIVNLLLTLVSLGLYYPFARVRKLRYFYGNTTVGEHAFDFHGDPWKMLRGFVLMAVLLGLYGLAGRIDAVAGLVALLIMAALWPALFRASMQFRLANTSWRGLRFAFSGSLGGAYRALLPVMVPALMYLGAMPFIVEPEEDGEQLVNSTAEVLMLAGAGLTAILLPLFWWSIKKYQHGHLALGPVRTELRAGLGAFYLLFLKAAGLLLLVVALVAGAVWLLWSPAPPVKGLAPPAWLVVLPLAMAVGYVLLLALVGSFVSSRLQNLVWPRTKSSRVRFESRLRARPLFWLTLKNWLLIVLTLGLYLPFAQIAKARLQLRAITVFTRDPPDELIGQLERRQGDAAGDAAADLVGIDVGL